MTTSLLAASCFSSTWNGQQTNSNGISRLRNTGCWLRITRAQTLFSAAVLNHKACTCTCAYFRMIHKRERLPFPYSLGFCVNGLFKYSRHPNFFAEQVRHFDVVSNYFKSSISCQLPIVRLSGGAFTSSLSGLEKRC